MKKFLSITLVLMLVLSLVPISVFAELAKDGDVYLIGSAADLVEFKDMVNAAGANTRFDAKLTADIDMSSVTDWTPIGNHKLNNGGTENDGYMGTFDGDGHTISNLNVTMSEGNWNSGSYNYSLLFGVLANNNGNAVAQNFTLKDSSLTINGADGKEVFVGGICNNINRAKIINVTLDNVDIIANGQFSGGAIGLVSQCGTWDPNLIERVTIKDNCSIKTETPKVAAALVCARSFNDWLRIVDCTVDGTIDAPKGARVAALCAYLNTGERFIRVTNNTTYPAIGSDPVGEVGWVYYTNNQSKLTGTILNDKINKESAQITEGTISGWSESVVANLFDDNLFGTKLGGGFSGPVTITWQTTEAVTVKSYALVTGGDTASNSGRNATSWTLYGSTDGENWTALDVADPAGMLALNDTAFVFKIDAPAAYSYYKITINGTGNGQIQNDSIILLDDVGTEAKVFDLNTGATVDGGTWTKDGDTYTLTEARARNHEGFNTYILGETDKPITLTIQVTPGVGDNFASDIGLMFGVDDDNGDGKIFEGQDFYYLVDVRANRSVGIERNAKGWGDWYIESAEGSVAVGEDGKATLDVTYDPAAHTITVKQGDTVLVEYADYSISPISGKYYAIASKQTADTSITVTAVVEEDPTETGDQGDDPTNTQTGDIAAIAIAAVAVMSLAGVAVVATKRRKIED